MEEKKSVDNRLTIILLVVLGAVVVAVATPLVIMRLGVFQEPVPDLSFEIQEPGPLPSSQVVTTPGRQTASSTVVVPERFVPAERAEQNTFCRSYVFSRCNKLLIPGSDCTGIADVASRVPRTRGMAGCRTAVDELIERAAERVTPERAAQVGQELKYAEPEKKLEPYRPPAGSEKKQPSKSADVKTGVRGPNVVIRKPGQAEFDAGMARIRQLETEINVQRNTYVGTGIGIQSRLDEVRDIAEKLDDEKAKSTYNSILKKLGRTEGGATPPPAGSEVRAVSPSSVEAAPSSL